MTIWRQHCGIGISGLKSAKYSWLLATLLLGTVLSPRAPAQAQDLEQRLNRLMQDMLIVDAHIDTPWYIVDEGYRLADKHSYYEADIPRLRQGKAGAIFFGVVAEPDVFPPSAWIPRALEVIDAVHTEALRNPNLIEIGYSSEDILRIHRQGKIGILLSLEGGHIIRDSLGVLRMFHRLGVRYMTLTHFNTNNWADSSTDKAIHNGISAFGKDVVHEMNRIGMIIDVSHVSDKSFYDVLETSVAPVIASHSSIRAICDIPRNMDDEMVRALARNNGVACVNFSVAYLDQKSFDTFAGFVGDRESEISEMMARNTGNPNRWALKRAIQQRYRARLPRVGVTAVLQHIDHVVKLVGADHVGLGSDFDGVSGMVPEGLEDVSKYPTLVRGMIDLGYSDLEIRKIMGENLFRVMQANEEVAAKLQGR